MLSEYSNPFCVMESHTINGLFSEKPVNTIPYIPTKESSADFTGKLSFNIQ